MADPATLEQVERLACGLARIARAEIDPWLRLRAPDSSSLVKVEQTIESEFRRLVVEIAGPDVTVLGEEAVAAGERPVVGEGPFVTIDPIDGTRLLLEGRSDYASTFAVGHGRRLLGGSTIFPGEGRRVTAISGQGIFVDGAPRRASWNESSRSVAFRGFRPGFDQHTVAAIAALGWSSTRLGSTARRCVEICEGRLTGLVKEIGRTDDVPHLWGIANGLICCDVAGVPIWLDRRGRVVVLGAAVLMEAVAKATDCSFQRLTSPERWCALWGG